jgi:2-amino-4-hydroxy-6-hydroxymethyldihydropteridine diphosphokinase
MLNRAVLSLGTNLGDRLSHLQAALDALARLPGTAIGAVSPIYETAPVGGPPQPDYLNIVVALETDLSPARLLDHAHGIEAALHRTREVRWGPRTLDIDVIAIDDILSDDPSLTIPHPRASERLFVLMPWYDLDHDAALPGGARVADLMARLEGQVVTRRDDLRLTVATRGSVDSGE